MAHIVVVGAGIGGLTLAALAARAGHQVTVVERANELGEVGAGIQISPNAGAVLDELGVRDGLLEVGTTPAAAVSRRWDDDRELLRRPFGGVVQARYGRPYLNVYRPDLIELLTGALPHGVELRLGTQVVAVDPTTATVSTGDGETLAADVVVGADGIHSAVRDAIVGPFPSRFSGYVAYRALVPRELVADQPVEVTNRMGPDAHVVTYFVGREQRFFNVVCVAPEPAWDVESWTEPASLADLRDAFAAWSPGLQAILEVVTEPIFRWALHDRQPLPQWSSGRATLLGDACHPMLPFMAQGACQAIEDAMVLVRCLALDDETPAALRRYEALRRPRTAEIQRRSWRNATVFHLPDGPEQQVRDERLAAASRLDPAQDDALDWLYTYDATTVSLDPSEE